MRFEQIKAGELTDYINSDEYNSLQHLPISSLRAHSQALNPSASPDDIALIIAFDDQHEVVGYIGILPGYINTSEGKVKVYWNSCWWVDPERGRTIAIPLFLQFLKVTVGKTLIKGLTPHTKKIVSRSRELVEVDIFSGVRCFFRLYLRDIIGKKIKILTPFLALGDGLFNSTYRLWQLLFKPSLKVTAKYVTSPDDDCIKFINKNNSRQFFNRDDKEISWICHYPWLTTDPSYRSEADKYFFSFLVKSFETYLAKIYKGDSIIAIVMFSERDGHYKTPYVYCNKEDSEDVVSFIISHLILKKAKSYHTHNPLLLPHIFKYRQIFYHLKNINEDLTISSDLAPLYSRSMLVQDGDGDSVFT